MTALEAEPVDSDVPRGRRESDGSMTSAAAVAAFLLPAAGVLLYSLRGGSYDLVVRQELGLAIWWILALGFATGLLPRSHFGRPVLLVVGAFGLLAGLCALALTYTESDERTTNELARTLHHAGVFVLLISLLDQKTWRAAALGLTAGAVTVCLLALASRLWPSPFPLDAVNREFPGNRLNYPFGYWNATAAFSVMAAMLALGLSTHCRLAVTRALALAPVPAIVAVTYLTYSRGGIVALAVGIAVLFTCCAYRGLLALHVVVAGAGGAAVIVVIRSQDEIANNTGTAGAPAVALACLFVAVVCGAMPLITAGRLDERLRTPSRIARAGVALSVVAAAFSAVVFGPDLVDRVVDGLRAPPALTGSADPAARLTSLSTGRYEHWEAALDTLAQEPLRGIGPGTFEFAWNRSSHYTSFVRDAHSLYFESLAEGGWLGLSGVVLVLGAILAGALAIRVLRRGDPETAGLVGSLLTAFVVFVVYAGYDWMWEATAVATVGLAAGAVAIAAGSRERRRTFALPVRIALVAVALVAAAVQIPALVATSQVRQSQQSIRDSDLQAALNHAQDAIASAPWAASPYVQRGLVFERSGELRLAERDLERAWEREPANYRHPLLLARVRALRDQPQAALRAFRAAQRLAPHKPMLGGPRSPAGQADEP